MNESIRPAQAGTSDVDVLIVPFSAFFGPVYRPLKSAEELGKNWSSTVTWGLLVVVVATLALVLMVALRTGGANDPADLFERPVAFWSLMFGVLVARWLIGVAWVVRHRSSLARVRQGLTLDERFAANHGRAGLVAARWDAWGSALVTLVFLVAAMLQMDSYPWIFGPMTLMFGVQSWAAFRVLRFHSRRAAEMPSNRPFSDRRPPS